MPRKLKLKECRPFLGKDPAVDYHIAFRIPKGSSKYDAIIKGWVVFVWSSSTEYWIGRITRDPYAKNFGNNLFAKNVVATVRFKPSFLAFGAKADSPGNLDDFPFLFPVINDDPETVTLSTGPTMMDLTQVIDDSDVVVDVP